MASFIRITIEYVLNKDFIAGGIFTTIALFIIATLQIKKKNSHKD
ncbi:hypothetical protein [Vagococcus xieshaowenii]|nr:hypothetical protein [Vagococcus xieshaowenii]